MYRIFDLLRDCLKQLGKPFGWNYTEASVYICIHLWPILCVAMSLVMLGIAVTTGNGWWVTACTVYALLNAFGYWAVVKHYYPGSNEVIFERCMKELIAIAREWHTTYAVVNLVIYVLLFAAIMAFNSCLIILMLSL